MRKYAQKAPGKPGRLSAQQTAELPKRLLDAALILFNRKGFSATTMEEVAREAGASTKTLYSRYANKTELARAVATRMVEENLAMQAAATSPDPSKIEPRLFLTVLGRGVLTRLGGDGAGMIRVAFSEARHFPELVPLYEDVMTLASGNIARALIAWKGQGLLPNLGDPHRTARLCISMMTDIVRIRIAMGGSVTQDDLDVQLPFAVDLFLRGLGYRNAT